MRRRELLLGAFSSAGWSLTARAQQPGRTYRIGFLSASYEGSQQVNLGAFIAGMRGLGYDDKRIAIVSRYAEAKLDRLPTLARELVEEKPDCLLVPNTPPNLAMKAATSTIPIVMVAVGDPVGVGLVPSLARPGANITGTTNIVPELAAKRLEILREILPKASKVAVILFPDDPIAQLQMREVEAAARKLGVHLGPVLEVRGVNDLEPAFKAAAQAGVDGVLRFTDPIEYVLRKPTAALAARYRLPVVYSFRTSVIDGALISYGVNSQEDYHHAATIVHKILQGARPADIPIERPTRIELVINVKSARELGLVIPPSILARADEVIE